MRMQITSYKCFDPLQLFRNLDKEEKGFISLQNLKEFLK